MSGFIGPKPADIPVGTIATKGTLSGNSLAIGSNVVANTSAISIGSATINSTAFSGLSAATNTFTIGTAAYHVANGNLGIGNTSPNEKLLVNGAAKFTSSAVSLDQAGAYIDYSTNIARIAGCNPSGGTISFLTNPNGGFNTERMRITSGGNIGIGTSSPVTNRALTINGADYFGIELFANTIPVARWMQEGTSGGVYFDYGSNTQAGRFLNIRSSSTPVMYIDAAGNTGIGYTSPLSRLHVANEIRIGRTDASSEGGEIKLCRSIDDAAAYSIDVYGSTTNPELRMFNSIGGTVFFSSANSGVNYIKFNPTASNIGDANALDDYEEGTFTPTVAPSSGAITSYTASGVYTKIGRVVEVTISVGITNVGTAAGAYLNVYGLPFTSGSNYFIGVCRENAVNGYLSQVSLGSGATSFSVLLYNNNGVLVNGGDYKMSIVYRTST